MAAHALRRLRNATAHRGRRDRKHRQATGRPPLLPSGNTECLLLGTHGSRYEQIFLGIYSSPLLQALVGLKASDESPRRHPGLDPERVAFIERRVGRLRERLAEGGLREAAIRSFVYIGLAGTGVDERAFNQLRRIRAEHADMSLAEFKQVLREQFFALMLDLDGALAAIPTMLPDDIDARTAMLEAIREVVSAAAQLTGDRAERMTRIERLFNVDEPAELVSGAVGETA